MVVSSTSLICGATRSPVIAASRPDPSAATCRARPSLSRVEEVFADPSPGPRGGVRASTAPREAGEALSSLWTRWRRPRLTNIARAPPLAGSSIPSAGLLPRAALLTYRNSRGGPSATELSRADRGGDGGVLKLILSLFIHYSRIQCARLCIAAPPASSNKIAEVTRPFYRPFFLVLTGQVLPLHHVAVTPQSPAVDGEDASRSLGPPTCGAYTQPLAGP